MSGWNSSINNILPWVFVTTSTRIHFLDIPTYFSIEYRKPGT